MKNILIGLMLLFTVPAIAQEFKEDKFALTYYDLNYSPQGKKVDPYFIIQEIDKAPKEIDPLQHLFNNGKPGAFNFSKLKNRWMKGATIFIKDADEEYSKSELCELLKVKQTNRKDNLIFVYSGIFTVEETGNYRLKNPCCFLGVGTTPGNLRVVYRPTYSTLRSKLAAPEGNNPVKIEFEPKTYKEQWAKYGGHWMHLVAGTKYYFVLIPEFPIFKPWPTAIEKIKSPNEESSVVKPFKNTQK